MRTNRILSILAIVLSLVAIYTNYTNKTKIAYVETEALANAFPEIKEINRILEKKDRERAKKLNKLINIYQEIMIEYNKQPSELRKKRLLTAENEINKYKTLMDEKFKQDEIKLLNKALKKLKNKVFVYGQTKGYDLIVSGTNTGSLLYGDSSLNITNNLIKYITN